MQPLEPQTAIEVATAPSDLSHFEATVFAYLGQSGLPTNDVFVDVKQRAVLIDTIPHALHHLNEEKRGQATYISKMVAASTVGLFDAALNYLWDELVQQLRTLAANYDLSYFFDIAAKSNDLRKQLETESDLKRLNDQSLLDAS